MHDPHCTCSDCIADHQVRITELKTGMRVRVIGTDDDGNDTTFTGTVGQIFASCASDPCPCETFMFHPDNDDYPVDLPVEFIVEIMASA